MRDRRDRPDRAAALRDLLRAIEDEARRTPFDVCLDTYREAGRDPAMPILCAGSLDAPFCALGRELGREEVLLGEPLVGTGGRRFRRAFHDAALAPTAGPAPKSERRFARVLDRVLLTNLVPYRPVGNRAYDRATVARFRPFVEALLAELWTGTTLLALGETSFRWLAPYAAPGLVDAVWTDPARRFEETIPVTVRGRRLVVAVLPHPSPLSPFKKEFASLLARRVSAGRPRSSGTARGSSGP